MLVPSFVHFIEMNVSTSGATHGGDALGEILDLKSEKGQHRTGFVRHKSAQVKTSRL
jgi:hypothetical protein